MSITTEIEGREDCPVIGKHCNYYGYQCDNYGEVAISFCSHPENPMETEGNTTNTLCPIVRGKSDLELLISGEFLGTEDEQFKSFIKAIPEGHWSKLDISAVRFGWEAAKRLLKK